VNARRTLAATAVLLGLVASSADASGTVALDGKKHTKASYSASLSEPAASTNPDRASAQAGDPTMPSLADCTQSACDITDLRLSVPKGSTAGWFEANVTVDRTMNVTVVLYDAKGRAVEYSDVTRPCCNGTVSTGDSTYVVPLAASRLRAGSYQLVVFDRGGLGSFSAAVEFHAHPPDRKPQ
jgi:hypothetical protein